VESIQRLWKSEREFVPSTESGDMKLKVAGWEKAIYATRAWSKK
jgi:glycerol kinase